MPIMISNEHHAEAIGAARRQSDQWRKADLHVPGKGIGRKTGSNVGAEQPFGLVKGTHKASISPTEKESLDANERAFREKYGKK